MQKKSIFIVTGGTSGIGLEVVRTLAKPSHRIIVGARRPNTATELRKAGGDSLTILPLDVASLQSVRFFASSVRHLLESNDRISALACNAGMQAGKSMKMSEDGVELTFATNHLGHFLLTHELLPFLEPGAAVISTASGTHDPQDKLAARFGFRGGIFPSAQRVASGDIDNSVSQKQQSMDRYATSKLCNILFTMEMARRIPSSVARFIAFDPGLMPGT
ncbi:MAG: SDR family NAD(P)-dependent oxidoreductase [Chitinophagales bacterium]|nr:SDR family NAD(P)-dependent oxidoreductase [Hyphomicrobiales bacterium]